MKLFIVIAALGIVVASAALADHKHGQRKVTRTKGTSRQANDGPSFDLSSIFGIQGGGESQTGGAVGFNNFFDQIKPLIGYFGQCIIRLIRSFARNIPFAEQFINPILDRVDEQFRQISGAGSRGDDGGLTTTTLSTTDSDTDFPNIFGDGDGDGDDEGTTLESDTEDTSASEEPQAETTGAPSPAPEGFVTESAVANATTNAAESAAGVGDAATTASSAPVEPSPVTGESHPAARARLYHSKLQKSSSKSSKSNSKDTKSHTAHHSKAHSVHNSKANKAHNSKSNKAHSSRANKAHSSKANREHGSKVNKAHGQNK